MLKALRQPFPVVTEPALKWRMSIFLGLFVTLFLWLFKPFGLHNVSESWVFVGYGLITTLIVLFNLFILPKIFPRFYNEENWTGFKELVVTLWNILIIGLGNLLFSVALGFFRLDISTLIYFQLITLAVAVLPVLAMILLRQNTLLKKNLAETQKISAELPNVPHETHPDEKITFVSDVVNDTFQTLADNLLYITSSDNYIEIFYLENGALKKKLQRNTLKKAETILVNDKQFFRCHRMYIVNLDKVENVSGNAQGYKLHLQGSPEQIPVSRNLNKTITERLLHR